MDDCDPNLIRNIGKYLEPKSWYNFHRSYKYLWKSRSLDQYYYHKTNFFLENKKSFLEKYKYGDTYYSTNDRYLYHSLLIFIIYEDDLLWLNYYLERYRGKFTPTEFAIIISKISTKGNKKIFPESLINFDGNLKEKIKKNYHHQFGLFQKQTKKPQTIKPNPKFVELLKTETLRLQSQIGQKFILFHLRELCTIVNISIFNPQRYSYNEKQMIDQLLEYCSKY